MFSLKGAEREPFGSREDSFDHLLGSKLPAFPLWHVREAQLNMCMHPTAKCTSWMLFCKH